MKVSIKQLAVSMDLGNKGFELDVYDSKDVHLGDLGIGKAGLEWCRGKTHSGNGVKISWNEFITWAESADRRAG